MSAERELTMMRAAFVSSVSSVVLKQLIDTLVCDGVLNEEEAEYILEESQSRADRARELMHSVRKKGDGACRKMITHLQTIDPLLSSQLGLSSGCSSQTDVFSQKETSVLIPSRDDDWGPIQSKNIYSVTEQSRSNRVALLVTSQRLNRHADMKDELSMLYLLRHLEYEVVQYRDLTGKGIDKALIKFSKHPKLSLTDSVFVVIMCHGDSGVLLGTDHDVFKIDQIYEHLSAKNCPALMNKPKVIIIQTFIGKEGLMKRPIMKEFTGNETQSESRAPATEVEIASDPFAAKQRSIYREKDFISFLFSVPDMVPYSSKASGSFFVDRIVEVFRTFSSKVHIEELFRKIAQRFEDFPADRILVPIRERCSLTKSFYLFPSDSQVKQDPNAAKLMEPPSCFTPEVQTESAQISYRFNFPGSGLFQCSLTGLVFDMTQEAKLLYRIIQWDERSLTQTGKTPAGPLFDIKGREEAVRRLHFPHCETKDGALHSGSLLSVVHFSDDGMSVLKPLEITDTHVIVEVPHLSAFGLVRDIIKSLWNTTIRSQILLFLRQPQAEAKMEYVDMLLLPRNVPLQEVKAQHPHSDYISVASNCELIKDENYTVHCPTAIKVQPNKAKFDMEFGPNYHVTFKIDFALKTEEVTVTVRDQRETEVWEHDIDLTAVPRSPFVTSIDLQELPQSGYSLKTTLPVTIGPQRNVPLREVRPHLLSILKDLNDDDFKDFRWHLKSESWNNIEPIKEDQLSMAERREVVDLMLQTYEITGTVEVMKSILEKIPRNDLLTKLTLTRGDHS